MPAKMISDMPLPMPRSVICSPSHITKTLPVVIVSIVVSRKPKPGVGDDRQAAVRVRLLLERVGVGRGLDQAQRDGAVAGVLGDLAPAQLAFLRQPLQVRPDDGQQLQDDRRADVGHDAQREDRGVRQVPAREHVVEAEHRVLGLFGEDAKRLGVHARRRDVRAETEHGQHAQREENAIAELRNRGDGAKALDHVLLVPESESAVAGPAAEASPRPYWAAPSVSALPPAA